MCKTAPLHAGFKDLSSTTTSRSREAATYFLFIGPVFLCVGVLFWMLENQLSLNILAFIVGGLVLALIGARWFFLYSSPK